MSTLLVHDKLFEPYLSEVSIGDKVKSIAGQLNKDYDGKKPLFIAILNGSFIFAADLLKQSPMKQKSVL